jgi:hypothetical protein
MTGKEEAMFWRIVIVITALAWAILR